AAHACADGAASGRGLGFPQAMAKREYRLVDHPAQDRYLRRIFRVCEVVRAGLTAAVPAPGRRAGCLRGASPGALSKTMGRGGRMRSRRSAPCRACSARVAPEGFLRIRKPGPGQREADPGRTDPSLTRPE